MSEQRMMSFYDNIKSKNGKNITLENYIGFIQHGANQDLVLKARALKESGDIEGYKKLKNSSKIVTGSCVISDGKSKSESNIESMNGLLVIDVDGDQIQSSGQKKSIQEDKYTHIMHQSFGGGGNYCVFIKTDADKFLESFLGISEYYFKVFGITVDQSCKNKNRLRYLSYDPDIYVNEKSAKFIPKLQKRNKEIPKPQIQYVYHKDDMEHILEQISDRNIDLCQEDYFRYVRIGMAFAREFGEAGRHNFHFVCQYGGKYNAKTTDKDYSGFIQNNDGRCTIGTFYYYCKEEGIEIYTPKTKKIINRVKISKTQGNPTLETISKALKTANDIVVSEEDKRVIQLLIESRQDYSKHANEDLTETEQLANFIVDTYDPQIDEITQTQFSNGKRMTDRMSNDIYLACKKSFPFKVSKADVQAILNSSYTRSTNELRKFITANKNYVPGDYIQSFIDCVTPNSEYSLWAFRKWIVSAVHNWVSPLSEKIVSPLTLVLTGQTHGTGKTSFLRSLIPDELTQYVAEGKINAEEKDSMYLICTTLMVIDDEFGGKAFKDTKAYKAISDSNIIMQRRPYGREIETFKRRAILCGTSNEVDILKDVTGNRRILPINVERIDFEAVRKLDPVGLIMEAYDLYHSGFEWQIYRQADIDYIKANTGENEVVLPVEELFFKFFSFEGTPYHNIPVVMSQGDILDFLIANSRMNPNKYDLKEVLTKNKMTYKTHRTNEGFKKGFLLYMRDSTQGIRSDDKPF